MKAYVQYLDYSPITGKIYEPCGDRAVLILDGRNSLETMIQDGHKFNGFQRPNYPHFEIRIGKFTESRMVYSTLKGN